jgi:hypothetical protein
MFESAGPCKLLASGICVEPDAVTGACYYGTLTCAEISEMVFDVNYHLLDATDTSQHTFRLAVLSAVARMLVGSGGDGGRDGMQDWDRGRNRDRDRRVARSVVAGVHLTRSEGNTEGDIVAAVEFRGETRFEAAAALNRQVAKCKICIAFEGRRYCSRSRHQAACSPNPLACSPNPCLNQGVCLPTWSNSTAYVG